MPATWRAPGLRVAWVNCIWAAEAGFCTKWCTSDQQTPRPPSSTHHHSKFRPRRHRDFSTIPLSIRCTRVWSSNLSTQLRRAQTLTWNTESLPVPATEADPRQSHDSEQISPATIAHHTVYEKTRNLQQSHVCQCVQQSYLVGPLSRLVGKPPFEPSLSKNVLPLTPAECDPNGAILLTQTWNRILFFVCNGRYFGVKKAKNGDRGRIVFTAALRKIWTQLNLLSNQKVEVGTLAERTNILHDNKRVLQCYHIGCTGRNMVVSWFGTRVTREMVSDGDGWFIPAGIVGFHTLSLLLASLVAHDRATEDNHTHHTGRVSYTDIKKGTTTSWVQYIGLDREVLTSSPCE